MAPVSWCDCLNTRPGLLDPLATGCLGLMSSTLDNCLLDLVSSTPSNRQTSPCSGSLGSDLNPESNRRQTISPIGGKTPRHNSGTLGLVTQFNRRQTPPRGSGFLDLNLSTQPNRVQTISPIGGKRLAVVRVSWSYWLNPVSRELSSFDLLAASLLAQVTDLRPSG